MSNSGSGFGRRTTIYHNDPNRFLDIVNARSPPRGGSRSRTGSGSRAASPSPIPIPNVIPRLRLRVGRRVSFEEPNPHPPSAFEYFSSSSASSSSSSSSLFLPPSPSSSSHLSTAFSFDNDDDLAYTLATGPSGGREERGRIRIRSRSRSRSRSRDPQTNHHVTIYHGVRHFYPNHNRNRTPSPPPVPAPPPPAFLGFRHPVGRVRYLPAPRHVPAPRRFPAPRLLIRQARPPSPFRPFQQVRFRDDERSEDGEVDDRLRVTVRTRTTNNGQGRRNLGDFDDDEVDSTTTVTTSYQYHDADADEMPRAAWGVLFDADERPTERLREVLAALGRWVVREMPGGRSTMLDREDLISPRRMRRFFDRYYVTGPREEEEWRYWDVFRNETSDESIARVQRLYDDLDVEYRPRTLPRTNAILASPCLTPRGFAEFLIKLILSYPESQHQFLSNVFRSNQITAPMDNLNRWGARGGEGLLPGHLDRSLFPEFMDIAMEARVRRALMAAEFGTPGRPAARSGSLERLREERAQRQRQANQDRIRERRRAEHQGYRLRGGGSGDDSDAAERGRSMERRSSSRVEIQSTSRGAASPGGVQRVTTVIRSRSRSRSRSRPRSRHRPSDNPQTSSQDHSKPDNLHVRFTSGTKRPKRKRPAVNLSCKTPAVTKCHTKFEDYSCLFPPHPVTSSCHARPRPKTTPAKCKPPKPKQTTYYPRLPPGHPPISLPSPHPAPAPTCHPPATTQQLCHSKPKACATYRPRPRAGCHTVKPGPRCGGPERIYREVPIIHEIPVREIREVEVAVPVRVEVPYEVPVRVPVRVNVPAPYPVHVPVHVPVPQPYPVYQNYNGGGGYRGGYRADEGPWYPFKAVTWQSGPPF
ncbi:hypothetical protein QBC32DRAFT_254855 [Pseudoneurospora amorphoporcata]|uniref:DUF7514 domain-containing protein n=1 Tax=Pseudoneurospora amorphoporcata TaxID=241081 RepID=A0AAN6P302_9PEZI|nr:hypothetical protein QBC32DRAFT_254855 [Pseudoneurospora amorphoporcata]